MTNPNFLTQAPLPAGRSIVFLDVDGTLIDSFPGIRDGFFLALDALDMPYPDDDFVAHIPGPPMEETLARAGVPEDRLREAFTIYMDYARDTGWLQADPMPGMAELLPKLKEQGFYLATATSKGTAAARQILDHFGMLQHLDFLGTAQEDGPRRGKAKVIEYVLDSLDLHDRTEDIIMVGDRNHDIDGAGVFGIDTIAVTWGYGDPDEWARAKHTVSTADQLQEVILGWHA